MRMDKAPESIVGSLLLASLVVASPARAYQALPALTLPTAPGIAGNKDISTAAFDPKIIDGKVELPIADPDDPTKFSSAITLSGQWNTGPNAALRGLHLPVAGPVLAAKGPASVVYAPFVVKPGMTKLEFKWAGTAPDTFGSAAILTVGGEEWCKVGPTAKGSVVSWDLTKLVGKTVQVKFLTGPGYEIAIMSSSIVAAEVAETAKGSIADIVSGRSNILKSAEEKARTLAFQNTHEPLGPLGRLAASQLQTIGKAMGVASEELQSPRVANYGTFIMAVTDK